jgi:hypothetical protein
MHFLARCRAAGIHLSTSAFHPCGRLSAPAILLTLLSSGSASAANEKGWHWRALGDDVLPYLIYEVAADQDHRFALVCDNQRRVAEVSVPETSSQARRGQPVTVELGANGQVVTMKGSIKTDNGVYGHVTKAPYKALVTLLRQPGPVTVKISGNIHTLGEKDRVKQLNEFISICKLR